MKKSLKRGLTYQAENFAEVNFKKTEKNVSSFFVIERDMILETSVFFQVDFGIPSLAKVSEDKENEKCKWRAKISI